jgi:hypothetical protein
MPRPDFGEIIRRLDGTYEIRRSGLPYHITRGTPLFSQVEEYAQANPNRVANEQPPVPLTLEEVKTAKLAEIAAARYAEEMSGLDAQAFHLATDDRSKALLAGAYMRAKGDAEFTVQWKGADGQFYTADAPAIIAAYEAITDWVETLFAREAELSAEVAAAETIEEVQSVKWET